VEATAPSVVKPQRTAFGTATVEIRGQVNDALWMR